MIAELSVSHVWLCRLLACRYRGLFDSEKSTWRCKVVLPHPKKSEEDVVLFLDQEYACDSEDEAQQRAAVVALQRIAGNRSLERTLPPSYVEFWKDLGEKAKVKEERMRRDEERRRREKESKAKALKRELRGQGPAQVIMTDEHRTMIEGILQDVKKEDGRVSNSRSAADVEDLAAELEMFGFVQPDAAAAASKCDSLSSALDWLCLNIPEDRLPAEFAAGAAGKPVTVIRWNDRENGADGDGSVVDPALAELERCGYEREDAASALESHKGDVLSSAVALFLSLCATVGLADGFGLEKDYQGDVSTNTLVEEEMMALDAIFGDMASFDGNRVSVRLAGDNGDGSGTTVVQFILPTSYPDVCPVCVVQNSAVSGHRIKSLMTATVLPALVSARGAPLMYDIATLVSETLIDVANDVVDDDYAEEESVAGVQAADDERGQRVLPSQDLSAKGKKRPHLCGLTSQQARQESDRLLNHHRKLEKESCNSRIAKQRQGLPAASMRGDVLGAINSSTATIIMGSTGCGKSTQVPQFILEDAIERSRGGECNIICTQPRRISAIGLASRVAQERAESVGSTVGYSVRLDSKQSKQTRLLFCTTGVMLRYVERLGDGPAGASSLPSRTGLTRT